MTVQYFLFQSLLTEIVSLEPKKIFHTIFFHLRELKFILLKVKGMNYLLELKDTVSRFFISFKTKLQTV